MNEIMNFYFQRVYLFKNPLLPTFMVGELVGRLVAWGWVGWAGSLAGIGPSVRLRVRLFAVFACEGSP